MNNSDFEFHEIRFNENDEMIFNERNENRFNDLTDPDEINPLILPL